MKLAYRIALILAIAATFVLLLFVARPVHAETLEAHQGADWIRITEAPCTNAGVAEYADPGEYLQMHAASAMIDNKPFSGCWLLVREGVGVGVIFDEGGRVLVPRAMFRTARGS